MKKLEMTEPGAYKTPFNHDVRSLLEGDDFLPSECDIIDWSLMIEHHLPAGFYYSEPNVDRSIITCGEKEEKQIFVSTPFVVSASIRTPDGQWGLLIEWHDDDLRRFSLGVPCTWLESNVSTIRRIMLRGGVKLGNSQSARDAFLEYISFSDPHVYLHDASFGIWINRVGVLPIESDLSL